MTILSEEEAPEKASSSLEDLYPYSVLVAENLGKRWHLCEVTDIAQEICLYVLKTPKVMEEWNNYCEGNYATEEDERHAANRMRLITRRAGERYCRKEMAERIGYRPQDEAFYGLTLLRALVEHYYTVGLTEHPPVVDDEGRYSKNDPAMGRNWLVSLLDVERGLKLIKREYRTRLKVRFQVCAGLTDTQIEQALDNLANPKGWRDRVGKALGVSADTAYARTRAALRQLQKALGGPNPYTALEAREQRPNSV